MLVQSHSCLCPAAAFCIRSGTVSAKLAGEPCGAICVPGMAAAQVQLFAYPVHAYEPSTQPAHLRLCVATMTNSRQAACRKSMADLTALAKLPGSLVDSQLTQSYR